MALSNSGGHSSSLKHVSTTCCQVPLIHEEGISYHPIGTRPPLPLPPQTQTFLCLCACPGVVLDIREGQLS